MILRTAGPGDLYRAYVSGIERGERNVSLANVEKLARALGLPMSALMP